MGCRLRVQGSEFRIGVLRILGLGFWVFGLEGSGLWGSGFRTVGGVLASLGFRRLGG